MFFGGGGHSRTLGCPLRALAADRLQRQTVRQRHVVAGGTWFTSACGNFEGPGASMFQPIAGNLTNFRVH